MVIDPAPEGSVLDGGPSFLNQGTLRASNGGILVLTGNAGGAFTNTGATIEALAGSEVQLTGSVSITGGTLSTTDDGIIRAVGSQDVYITGLTNAGTFVVDNNSALHTSGMIVNTGTFTFNSAGNFTDFRLAAATTLNGGGTVTLGSASNTNRIDGDADYRLTNNNNLIEGRGQIGANSIAVTNLALIDANVDGETLVIDPAPEGSVLDGGPSFLNQGTLQASNGGILVLSGNAGGAFTNTSHVIQALDASTVQLSNSVSILGGTLSTSGTGSIQVVGSQTATLTNVTNQGSLMVLNNAFLDTVGTLTNSGTIMLNSTGNNTDLHLVADTTLNGNGTVILSALSSNSRIAGDGPFRLTNVSNTIEGRGQIGANLIAITNQSLIDATANSLTLDPANVANAFVNTGTLRASSGGSLILTGNGGGDFFNAGGTIIALDGGEVQFTANASVTGGTLTSSGSGVIRLLDSQNGFISNLTNSGAFVVNNNAFLHTVGTITNSGSITLASSGNNTDLHLDADTTLNGGGTITLGPSSSNNRIAADSLFNLTNTNNLIQGSGQIGANSIAITNQGTIDANASDQSLTIDPANTANAFINEASGIVRASDGGILILSGNGGGDFTNAGTISAATGGSIQLTGALTSSGTVDIGNYFLAISGSGLYTQTDGTFKLAGGTVTSSSALNFAGGLVDAQGTISAAITNSANLQPALGGNGLIVNGAVSLLSASKLTFQLGGLTQGSQYGFLNVNGTVSLGGQLVLSFVNGFVAAQGNSFTVLASTGPLSGRFANVASGTRLDTSDGSGSFVVSYAGNSIILSDFLANGSATAATWTGANGNWSNAANWSTSPNSPNNGQPNTGEVYNATLDNGSTITLDVPVTIQKLTLSNGTITGSNSLTLNQLFTWDAGTLSGSGITNANGGIAFGLGHANLLQRTLNLPAGQSAVLNQSAARLFLGDAAVFNNSGTSWRRTIRVSTTMAAGAPLTTAASSLATPARRLSRSTTGWSSTTPEQSTSRPARSALRAATPGTPAEPSTSVAARSWILPTKASTSAPVQA